MTGGGDTPPRTNDSVEREIPVLGWRARLEALQRSVMRRRTVVVLMDVLRVFDRGGGAMLAAGLAYYALFTLVPALLLFVSLLGILIEDETLRAQLIEGLVDQVEPVAGLARFVVNELADTGRIGTVVGVVGLLWGASGFYGALQGAMQRMFPGPGVSNFLRTRLRGIVTVIFILGSMVTAMVVIFVLPLLIDGLEALCRGLNGLESTVFDDICSVDPVRISWAIQAVGAMGVAFLAALAMYVAVPPDGPRVRQAFWPAVVVGVIIGLLTSFFGLLAPLLVRQWAGLGLAGSVFLALIWFNLVFQILVFGAAFARIRRDRDRLSRGSPRL